MPSLDTFAVFVAAAVVFAIAPGPAVFYIVTRSLSQGRRAGALSALAVASGNLVHRIVQQMTIARARGRLAEVTGDLVETTGTDYPSLRPLALLSLVELGETAEARRLLQRWEMVVPQDWSTDFILAAWGEVAAALGAPDPDRLHAELLPYADELVVTGTANVNWGSVHGVLGRLAARRGDDAAAREHLAAAVRRNAELGAHPWAELARASMHEL